MAVEARSGRRDPHRTQPCRYPLQAVRTIFKLMVTLAIGALGLIVAIVAVSPAAHAFLTAGSAGGPSDVLALGDLPERSQVFDATGKLIYTFHAEENRDPVIYSEVPPGVINAVLDTEDATFFQHHGVNPGATARALFSNASAGGIKQGGSTITQQLVKNTLLTNERTVNRKFKEAVLAVRLEGELSKQQILERYLNTVYFGNGAYGIKAAAEVYFGVDVKALTRIQGALLAGLIRNPDGYDPFRFPDRCKARRDFVLDRMAANGHLTKAQAEDAKHVPMPTKKGVVTPAPDGQDSYFVEEVKQRLLNEPSLGDSPQARYNAVFRGGLKIYATLDPALEAKAKQAIQDVLPDNHGTWTSVLVSVDTKTGAVRSLIGGPGFDRSQYRIATEGPGRQPGSSFKPVVLAAALKEGYSVASQVNGFTPCTFPNPGAPNPVYTAHNDEGSAGYIMSLSDAMAFSVNCAYLRLGIDVGLDKVVEMGKQLGITTPLVPRLSMSIGTEEVRPIDMAGVYATFANDGVHHKPYVVDHVIDRTGKLIFKGGDAGTPVLSPAKAHEELIALKSVVTTPGATGAAAALPDREVAGKTGTAENTSNAWFDGVTPQLTTVVWMGSPVDNASMKLVGGYTANGNYQYPREVFGGTYPAMIWQEYMAKAMASQNPIPFPPADLGDLGNILIVKDPAGSCNGTALGCWPGSGFGFDYAGPGSPVNGPPPGNGFPGNGNGNGQGHGYGGGTSGGSSGGGGGGGGGGGRTYSPPARTAPRQPRRSSPPATSGSGGTGTGGTGSGGGATGGGGSTSGGGGATGGGAGAGGSGGSGGGTGGGAGGTPPTR